MNHQVTVYKPSYIINQLGQLGPTPSASRRLQLTPLQLRHVTLQPRQALHHRARRRQRRGAHWRRRHGATTMAPFGGGVFGETTNVVRKSMEHG